VGWGVGGWVKVKLLYAHTSSPTHPPTLISHKLIELCQMTTNIFLADFKQIINGLIVAFHMLTFKLKY
jgi:hypothetical protein